MDIVAQALKIKLEQNGHLDEIRNELRIEISNCFQSGILLSSLDSNPFLLGGGGEGGGRRKEQEKKDQPISSNQNKLLQIEILRACLEKRGVMNRLRATLRSKVCHCFQDMRK